MSRANILNTRTINYLELIGNGKGYRVPPYQRDYSWSEEQWEDLWNDVLELRGRPDDRHYMGALVVEGTSDREFLIIDGQQRMATLSILALAVIGKLRATADRGVEPAPNRERANELRNRFICHPLPLVIGFPDRGTAVVLSTSEAGSFSPTSCSLTHSSAANNLVFGAVPALQGVRPPLWPTGFSVYASPPLFTLLIVPLPFGRSAAGATLDTGGWLALTRRGLAPRKIRQASLGTIT